jgi:hypothetical protein
LLPVQTFHISPILNAFRPVTVSEVQRSIAKIPVKTSPLDCVPITLVKSCSDVFSVLLAHLTNLSFAESVFPHRFKLGQVTPILKKQGLAVDDPSNYRPISNLNTFGKIIERLAQSQLSSHICKSPNYGPLQSAYRAFHSTETAMTRVVNDLLVNVDSGSPSLLLSLDISAAFDTLNHERLLQRAEFFFLVLQVTLTYG